MPVVAQQAVRQDPHENQSQKGHCTTGIASTTMLLGQKGGLAMASVKDVIDHHLKCFDDGDLAGVLSDYAPGAVLFTPDGPLKGSEAIRPLFKAMIAEFGKPGATVEFGKPGATFSLEQQFIEGDYAYILWSAETVDNVYEMGTDTFVVRDGKIVAQSFTGKVTPKG